jgi:hypothetical protein
MAGWDAARRRRVEMLGNLENPKLIVFKGFLFLLLGFFSFLAIVAETLSWRVSALLLICIWAFCRFYYFAFYVIGNYLDNAYKFSGLADFALYWLKRKK